MAYMMSLKPINLDLKKISEKRACANQINTLLYAYRQRDLTNYKPTDYENLHLQRIRPYPQKNIYPQR